MSTKIKILYAVLAILIIYTLWPTDSMRDSETIRVWKAHVDEAGKLNVLGVTLGDTTLKAAETALYTQSERALFVSFADKENPKETLEAFFPTSPDRAKIVIELDAPEELLAKIRERAYKAIAFPSGNAKMEVAPEHTKEIDSLIVKSLTYIPPIKLTPELITKNFGEAQEQITDVDSNLHLLYPDKGLDVVIPDQGKTLLQFVPPQDFQRLIDLIIKAPATKEESSPSL